MPHIVATAIFIGSEVEQMRKKKGINRKGGPEGRLDLA